MQNGFRCETYILLLYQTKFSLENTVQREIWRRDRSHGFVGGKEKGKCGQAEHTPLKNEI